MTGFTELLRNMDSAERYFLTDVLNIDLNKELNLAIVSRIYSFIKDIKDPSVSNVLPLTEYETYCLRKYSYGFSTYTSKYVPDNKGFESIFANRNRFSEIKRIDDKLRCFFKRLISVLSGFDEQKSKLNSIDYYNVLFSDDIEYVVPRFKKICPRIDLTYLNVSYFDSVDIEYLKKFFNENEAETLYSKMNAIYKICSKVSFNDPLQTSTDILDNMFDNDVSFFIHSCNIPNAVAIYLVKHGYYSDNIGTINESVLYEAGVKDPGKLLNNIKEYINGKTKGLYFKGEYKFNSNEFPEIIKLRRKLLGEHEDEELNSYLTFDLYSYRLIKMFRDKYKLSTDEGPAPDIRYIREDELELYLDYLSDTVGDEIDNHRNLVVATLNKDFLLHGLEEEHILVDECNYSQLSKNLKILIGRRRLTDAASLAFGAGSADIIVDVLDLKVKPSMIFLTKICDALNADIDTLLKDTNFNKKYYITIMKNKETLETGIYVPGGIEDKDLDKIEIAKKKSTILNNQSEDELDDISKEVYEHILSQIDMGTKIISEYFMKKYSISRQKYNYIRKIIDMKGIMNNMEKEKRHKASNKELNNVRFELRKLIDAKIYPTKVDIQRISSECDVCESTVYSVLKFYRDQLNKLAEFYKNNGLIVDMRKISNKLALVELYIYRGIKLGEIPSYADMCEKYSELTEEQYDEIISKYTGSKVETIKEKQSRKPKYSDEFIIKTIMDEGKEITYREFKERFEAKDTQLNRVRHQLYMNGRNLVIDGRCRKQPKKQVEDKIKEESVEVLDVQPKVKQSRKPKYSDEEIFAKIIEESKTGIKYTIEEFMEHFEVKQTQLHRIRYMLYKQNIDFIVDGRSLRYASKDLKNDKDVVTAAVKCSTEPIEFLDVYPKEKESIEVSKEIITPDESINEVVCDSQEEKREYFEIKKSIKRINYEFTENLPTLLNLYSKTMEELDLVNAKIAANNYFGNAATFEGIRRDKVSQNQRADMIASSYIVNASDNDLENEAIECDIENDELLELRDTLNEELNTYAKLIKIVSDLTIDSRYNEMALSELRTLVRNK